MFIPSYTSLCSFQLLTWSAPSTYYTFGTWNQALLFVLNPFDLDAHLDDQHHGLSTPWLFHPVTSASTFFSIHPQSHTLCLIITLNLFISKMFQHLVLWPQQTIFMACFCLPPLLLPLFLTLSSFPTVCIFQPPEISNPLTDSTWLHRFLLSSLPSSPSLDNLLSLFPAAWPLCPLTALPDKVLDLSNICPLRFCTKVSEHLRRTWIPLHVDDQNQLTFMVALATLRCLCNLMAVPSPQEIIPTFGSIPPYLLNSHLQQSNRSQMTEDFLNCPSAHFKTCWIFLYSFLLSSHPTEAGVPLLSKASPYTFALGTIPFSLLKVLTSSVILHHLVTPYVPGPMLMACGISLPNPLPKGYDVVDTIGIQPLN